MNYSVFKINNQGGKPGIFWDKDAFGFPRVPLYYYPQLPPIGTEPINKDTKKLNVRQRSQPHHIRKFPADNRYVETDLVTLTPEDPPPPPKPSKNFIQRNRDQAAANRKKKPDAQGTVTLTEEQLNAILQSVGKIAGGSDNALKISIDKGRNKNEITIESPRRKDNYDDDYRHDGRRLKKKGQTQKEEPSSIYSLLGDDKDRSSNSIHDSGTETDDQNHKDSKERRPHKNHRRDDEYEDDDYYQERDKRTQPKKKTIEDYDSKTRNRHKYQDELSESDDNDHERDNRQRRNKSKRDRDYDDYDIDLKDYDKYEKKERTRKVEKWQRDVRDDSKEKENRRERERKVSQEHDRKEGRDRGEKNVREDRDNVPLDNAQEDASPRDKLGLPIDLSWRHMTKAERYRLTMARQKLVDEEEKREEDRMKEIIHKLEPVNRPIEKKKAPRSDPASRIRPGRSDRRVATEESDYTDGYRRRRRSRSPEERRSRTPERVRPSDERLRTPEHTPESHHTYEASPKADVKGPVSYHHLTVAEKKRVEWERDRVESVQLEKMGDYTPWGRPGAGAPLRTKSGHIIADYKNRQELMEQIGEETTGQARKPRPPSPSAPSVLPDQQNVPHAMRSSFVFGERMEQIVEENKAGDVGARVALPSDPALGRAHVSRPPSPSAPSVPPDQQNVPHALRSSFVFGGVTNVDKFASLKEEERQQWKAELEKQIVEAKKLKEMKNTEVKEETTWADKLGQAPRPPDPTAAPGNPPDRVYTAPDTVQTAEDDSTFIRGQNVPIDPHTMKEWELKRNRDLEHQAAVKAQVEEKQREKDREREKKMLEDMEEERKLQEERDALQRQFDTEQQKIRQKEQQRQVQVNMLKAAMDDAQARAMQEKYQRKMQHLEKGGHDTSKLRENLEEQITSRIEQLHTRRERDILRAKHMMKTAEFYNQTWDNIKEEDESNTVDSKPPERAFICPPIGGTAKITPRSEATGDMYVEPSHIPGLDLVTTRAGIQRQVPMTASSHGLEQHDAYTENRVLTPSQYRHTSRSWSEPMSPRREFGTQTQMGNSKLLDNSTEFDETDVAIQTLNDRLHRERSDVHIEYREERGKRVRVISAPKTAVEKHTRRKQELRQQDLRKQELVSQRQHNKSPHEHHHEVLDQREREFRVRRKRLEQKRRHGPVRAGSRPKWNYKNTDYRAAAKQSERDPFYEQKKRESELRRVKREQQLIAMVAANRAIIPDYQVPPTQQARSRNQSPFSDVAAETPRELRLARRSKSYSPSARRVNNDDSEYLHGNADRGDELRVSKRREISTRERSESPPPQTFRVTDSRPGHQRQRSPPVPAIKHRSGIPLNDNENPSKKGGKYGDSDPLGIPLQNGDFVPFTRTIDVLDPAKADDPVPLSREGTRITNARKMYHEGQHPHKFGNRQHIFQDKQRMTLFTGDAKNPIMNPNLVTDHPTSRQDQILMQLSTLKQSLIQRQRELETFSPTDLEKQDSYMQ